MSKHILKGKPRLNLKRIQEAQVRTCCHTIESNGCARVVFGNLMESNAQMGLVTAWESGFNGLMGLVIAWEVCQVMSKQILKEKPRLNLKKHKFERVVAHMSRTDAFALYLRFRKDLILELES
ncbi:uncharacterized protein G2W53_009898 [Senna tora]|uniref:Uncharacterized protein n=1 Tax=Senna tora TaxID=362788 RepID=A0A834WZ69_9FABA|nr:uncharacterized protein G2W53_009898 [Senna tora]